MTDGQMSLTPVARTSDPHTSHEAAASIDPKSLTARRAAVLETLKAFGEYGATDDELGRVYRTRLFLPAQSDSGLRTRRSELVDLDLVVDSGERRMLPSGRRAIVWRSS